MHDQHVFRMMFLSVVSEVVEYSRPAPLRELPQASQHELLSSGVQIAQFPRHLVFEHSVRMVLNPVLNERGQNRYNVSPSPGEFVVHFSAVGIINYSDDHAFLLKVPKTN